MNGITIFCCCVALLPSIIFGGSSESEGSYSSYHSSSSSSSSDDPFEEVALNEAQAKIENVMKNNEIINNVFRPTKFLGRGGFSNTYKGELYRGGTVKIVAMKFAPTLMTEALCDNEYDMYWYMKAINNATVESYGIPAVYYYGEWEGCTMLAVTLLDSQFNQIINAPQLRIRDVDIYIISREFVRATKYVHQFGICHADFKLENMMFKNNRGFLIDFNMARTVADSKCEKDCRKRDWESFFLSILHLLRLNVDWDNPINNVKMVMEKFKHLGLKRILLEFARYAFKEPINYNRMYQIITEEIKRRGVQEPAYLSWLTDAQKNEAAPPIPDITSIPDPLNEFTYPEPDLNYFANH